MDDDSNGLVSFNELKRACQKLHWDGEVRLLFNCLDMDGKLDCGRRFIALKEVLFLDSWSSDPFAKQLAQQELIDKALSKGGAIYEATRSSLASRSSRPSSSRP